MRVGIVNYGMGNLASVARALEVIGYEPIIMTRPEETEATVRLVLPGVGAFAEAMTRLSSGGWVNALRDFVARDRCRLLGICLGMQLLADRGYEHGETPGLGLIGGDVRYLRDIGVVGRVPQIGWNDLTIAHADPILAGIPSGTDFYFVHSYAFAVRNEEAMLASTPYDVPVPAVVRRDNVIGTQFHPEKSSKAGLRLLKNFVEG